MKKMPLTEQRKGEIALCLLKHKIREEKICFGEMRRNIPNIAHIINVPANELKKFEKEIFQNLLDEAFH
ncbi:MAG: hypothetical protein ABR875_00030 [Minisyncoccia bacterium]